MKRESNSKLLLKLAVDASGEALKDSDLERFVGNQRRAVELELPRRRGGHDVNFSR
jgi:hypothetical protein